IDEVVPPAALLPRAQELAQRLALIPPQAYRLTKQALRAAALGRIDGAGEQPEQEVLEAWSAPQTHAHIREDLRRPGGKHWPRGARGQVRGERTPPQGGAP